ncbi:hypothetical protein RAP15_61 [Arthrobacter phage RAP15]|uniref:Uncharacterized protein n=2 Tax=Korravirus korra TaxID=1982082 RepID=A0A0U4B5U3_9CAUD|nr:hypothetical protein RAP15_61 [Arthrobacter phage RAP15]ATW58988.1 hypothetical protein PHIRE_MEGANNOLL_60 [Arthrobacter phage MeganNoll]
MGKVTYLIKCDDCGSCVELDHPLAEGDYWLCNIHGKKMEEV